MKKSSPSRNRKRIAIIIIAVVLAGITFTPLILRPGKMDPEFLSMPFTLWTSMIISMILVVLTYLASRQMDDD
jgi:multidrug efflux pump subunit AcrB